MCFDLNSTPPISSAAQKSDSSPQILTSADGTAFLAFLAKPAQPSGVGVVVLPDVRGLFRFYEILAQRLAEPGYMAIAIDYFGRTAGTGPRTEDFRPMEHIVRVSRPTIDDDIAAAANHLRSSGCRTILAVGFCFGGRQAFFASAPKFGFAGVIGFYGMPGFYPNGAAGPTQHAAELAAPILGLFGGDDHGISSNELDAFDAALKAAGVEHELVVYPGARHSFFDVKYEEHAAACADAWSRVLAFIQKQSSHGGRTVEP